MLSAAETTSSPQLKRLTDRLAKLDDTHLDAVLAKAEVVPLKRKCLRAGGDPPVTPPTDSQPPKA